VDDYFSEKKSGINQAEEIKSGQTKIDDLISEDSGFAVDEGKTYAVWSGGSCDGCQALNGTVYEVGFFGMVDGNIPETHPNCKCELTILDSNLLPTKEIMPLKKWAKDQKKPKPSGMIDLRKVTFPNNYTEGRKLGEDKQKKNWDDMTKAEQEKAKIKELDKQKSLPNLNTIRQNIKIAQMHRPSMTNIVWFYNQVRNGGEWDYKQQNKSLADFGNFNYGATGAALGIPDDVLYGMADFAAQRNGTDVNGKDDLIDTEMIQAGIDYYHSGIWR
jgi:hypothetical protein